jgi:hypothetical protein
MARAPYGPHIVTRILVTVRGLSRGLAPWRAPAGILNIQSLNELTSEKLVVKGMVVGSPTTARATPRTRVRAGWFWSPVRIPQTAAYQHGAI